MAFSNTASRSAPAWEARALARTLEPAALRSSERMHRIVEAARDLADETGSAAFTVAEIAERAALSLKSVYRCFTGKDEILLALLEEESRTGAEILAGAIGDHEVPEHRARAFVEQIFQLLTHPGAMGYAGVLVREHRRLSEAHPDELTAALAPLIDLLAIQIDATGTVDPTEVRRAARTVFGVVLAGIAEVTLGRGELHDQADWIWRFCASGLGVATVVEPREARR